MEGAPTFQQLEEVYGTPEAKVNLVTQVLGEKPAPCDIPIIERLKLETVFVLLFLLDVEHQERENMFQRTRTDLKPNKIVLDFDATPEGSYLIGNLLQDQEESYAIYMNIAAEVASVLHGLGYATNEGPIPVSPNLVIPKYIFQLTSLAAAVLSRPIHSGRKMYPLPYLMSYTPIFTGDDSDVERKIRILAENKTNNPKSLPPAIFRDVYTVCQGTVFACLRGKGVIDLSGVSTCLGVLCQGEGIITVAHVDLNQGFTRDDLQRLIDPVVGIIDPSTSKKLLRIFFIGAETRHLYYNETVSVYNIPLDFNRIRNLLTSIISSDIQLQIRCKLKELVGQRGTAYTRYHRVMASTNMEYRIQDTDLLI